MKLFYYTPKAKLTQWTLRKIRAAGYTPILIESRFDRPVIVDGENLSTDKITKAMMYALSRSDQAKTTFGHALIAELLK